MRSVAVRPDAAAEVEPADVGSQTAGAGSQAAVARLVLDLKLDLKLLCWISSFCCSIDPGSQVAIVPFLLDLNLLLVPYLNTVARARDEAVLLELKLPEDSAARSSDATPGLLLCFVALQFFFAMPITLSDHPPSTFRNWCSSPQVWWR